MGGGGGRSLIVQAMDDNPTTLGRLEILEMFESLVQRPHVFEDVRSRFDSIFALFEQELDATRAIFQAEHTNPPIYSNMPWSSGKINWARTLRTRVAAPMDMMHAVRGCLSGGGAGAVGAREKEIR